MWPDYRTSRSTIHIRRGDLLESIRRVINNRKKQFIRLSIFPEIEAAGDDWSVLTDEKWNGFVIDQLIANALKYASQTGPPIQWLTFRLERGNQAVALSISDQGPGIPAQDLPRVFEPFFTGENRATIIMVTHDPASASYTRRILFIKDGKPFTEIRRGADRKQLFQQILDVLSAMGGDGPDLADHRR